MLFYMECCTGRACLQAYDSTAGLLLCGGAEAWVETVAGKRDGESDALRIVSCAENGGGKINPPL